MGLQDDFLQAGSQEQLLNDGDFNELEKKLENAIILNDKHNITDKNILKSLKILESLHYVYLKNTHFKERFLKLHASEINDHYEVIKSNVDSDKEKNIEKNYNKIRIGGKRKSKSKKNNVSKKPVVSQNKQSEYKEILGKKMKIYKIPDSRKQYVRYKGELHSISDYKNLMKQKAAAKAKK
jgi:hypothetical protein